MDSPPSKPAPDRHPAADAHQLVRLAREDRAAAERALAHLSVESQVAIVCEAPLSARGRLLELLPEPERAIPLIPPGELCFTAKAMGIDDASWLLEYASEAQLCAVFDLDGWAGLEPDVTAIDHWFAALVEAGEESLVRAAHAVDPELLVIWLQARVGVVMKDGVDDNWEAPIGAHTLEGVFYILPRDPKDDLSTLLPLLHALFRNDYWLYFRMLQGVNWELPLELAEWALRWRTGRLEDLGFPSWEEAMAIYGFVRPEERGELPEAADALVHEAWTLPVWITRLPAGREHPLLIFRLLAELEAQERQAFFYGFLALANRVAVADRLPLGEPDTLPAAVAKAATVVSHGLEEVARASGQPAIEVLRRADLPRLFRVGASLSPETTHPLSIESDEDEDELPEEEEVFDPRR